MPASVKQYTSCYDVITQGILTVQSGKKTGPTGGSGGSFLPTPVIIVLVILILAAVYAGTGRLNIALVALLGFVGAVLGDNIGFAIGHFGGRPLVERYGRYVFLTPGRLDRATNFFDRHGGKIIVVARFIDRFREVVLLCPLVAEFNIRRGARAAAFGLQSDHRI